MAAEVTTSDLTKAEQLEELKTELEEFRPGFNGDPEDEPLLIMATV